MYISKTYILHKYSQPFPSPTLSVHRRQKQNKKRNISLARKDSCKICCREARLKIKRSIDTLVSEKRESKGGITLMWGRHAIGETTPWINLDGRQVAKDRYRATPARIYRYYLSLIAVQIDISRYRQLVGYPGGFPGRIYTQTLECLPSLCTHPNRSPYPRSAAP